MKQLIPILIILCFSSQVEASKNMPPLAHYLNVKGKWFAEKTIITSCEIKSSSPFPCWTTQVPRYTIDGKGQYEYKGHIWFSSDGTGTYKSDITTIFDEIDSPLYVHRYKRKAYFKIFKKQGKIYLTLKYSYNL